MSEWTAKAAARLEDECKSGKFDKYGSAMKEAVQRRFWISAGRTMNLHRRSCRAEASPTA